MGEHISTGKAQCTYPFKKVDYKTSFVSTNEALPTQEGHQRPLTTVWFVRTFSLNAVLSGPVATVFCAGSLPAQQHLVFRVQTRTLRRLSLVLHIARRSGHENGNFGTNMGSLASFTSSAVGTWHTKEGSCAPVQLIMPSTLFTFVFSRGVLLAAHLSLQSCCHSRGL